MLSKEGKVYRIATFKRLEVVNTTERSGILDPLNSLPGGHQPDIIPRQDLVQEGYESFFVLRCFGEPRCVEEKREWRSDHMTRENIDLLLY